MIERRTTMLREFFALTILFLAIFLGLSLFSYVPADPGLNHQVGQGVRIINKAGIVGAYTAGILVDFFGLGALAWPFASIFWPCCLIFPEIRPRWWQSCGAGLTYILILAWFSYPWALKHLHLFHIHGGGFCGSVLLNLSLKYLKYYGSILILTFLTLVAIQLTLGFSWTVLYKRARAKVLDLWYKFLEQIAKKQELALQRRQEALDPADEIFPETVQDIFCDPDSASTCTPLQNTPVSPTDTTRSDDMQLSDMQAADTQPPDAQPDSTPIPAVTATKKKTISLPAALSRIGSGKKKKTPKPAPETVAAPPAPPEAAPVVEPMPGLELLSPVPDNQPRIPQTQLDDLSKRLKACLADFGIQGEVMRVQPGPVITMLEFKPAPGVKISRISGLGDDLSLALKAMAVRIVAPLPGKDTVGVEIPNTERQTVYLHEILSSPTYMNSKAKIPLALGKDIQGQVRLADLTTMPHLLVAGATGAGKSVCLNTLILSILYKSSPEEVQLLMVDPKRIELAVYSALPHLVHPVVTDMTLAKNALDWAVYAMEQRYEAMAKLGVRNIASYNQKLKAMGRVRPEGLQELEPYPYMVIIVDELADLMLTAGKEVEVSIIRLAQLARAAGIHLILATQRPSVDVVTGLIKANFPSRIAFQVSSKHDSRTILDGVGAEYLLGRGDMLFKKSGGSMTRIHGAFVDDDEIQNVVSFWAGKGEQNFDLDFTQWKQTPDEGNFSGEGDNGNDIVSDPKYGEAVAFVMEQGKASISLIQRRLRIGFNKAARFIEQMEQDGVIGPQDGSKPRTVLKNQ